MFLNRNVKNIGLAESINRAWKMTKGELIVVQGGDDISLPERASESVTRWTAATPRPDLVYSNVIFMDTKGEIDKIVTKAVKVPTLGDIIQGEHFIAGGMAAAYSRQLIEESRPLDSRVIYEDVVLTFRALVGNGIAHIAKPLVKYRRHENSIMAKAVWPSKERYVAQQRARHKPAEKEDRLETWLNSETSNPLFTWRLKRELAQVKLDAYSCMASRRAAILCCLWAIATLRPKTVSSLFIRDVLRI